MNMRLFTARLVLSLLLLTGVTKASLADAPAPASTASGSFMALCYHNVEDEDPDQTYDGVTTTKLIEQLSWLQKQGYVAISVDDLLLARAGRKQLPPKAVMLTFDDGYESFYTKVYPILRAFHFPAVIGVVDEWMVEKKKGKKAGPGASAGDRVNYGETTLPRSAFLTWKQIREMQKSGLVEVASHSHAMHYGVMANPQGNKEPDALTSVYDPRTGSYEMASAYAKRLQIQEKLTAQVANTIEQVLKPKGVAVVIEAAHQCMTTRGIHKPGVTMVTSRMLGEFRDNPATRREFMALIHNQHSGGLSNV